MSKGPETLRETSFVQSFGHDLRIAREHLAKYTLHNDNTEIQQAWDIYYAVSSIGYGRFKLTSRSSSVWVNSSSCSLSSSCNTFRPDL